MEWLKKAVGNLRDSYNSHEEPRRSLAAVGIVLLYLYLFHTHDYTAYAPLAGLHLTRLRRNDWANVFRWLRRDGIAALMLNILLFVDARWVAQVKSSVRSYVTQSTVATASANPESQPPATPTPRPPVLGHGKAARPLVPSTVGNSGMLEATTKIGDLSITRRQQKAGSDFTWFVSYRINNASSREAGLRIFDKGMKAASTVDPSFSSSLSAVQAPDAILAPKIFNGALKFGFIATLGGHGHLVVTWKVHTVSGSLNQAPGIEVDFAEP